MSNMLEFKHPIPVIVKDEQGNDKEGYALYVESMGMHNNDSWAVAISENGLVRHFSTKDIRLSKNFTYEINTK